MGYPKTLFWHEIHVSFAEKAQKDHRITRSALYFRKRSKKHTIGSGNSSPLFSGGVKTHFFVILDNRSIIRYGLEGGWFKTVKSGENGDIWCQNC